MLQEFDHFRIVLFSMHHGNRINCVRDPYRDTLLAAVSVGDECGQKCFL